MDFIGRRRLDEQSVVIVQFSLQNRIEIIYQMCHT